MPLNFDSLDSGDSADTVLHPREIFGALPNKNVKYGYPRDVQTEVWNKWHNRRTESDLIVKLNTGAGKTVVGLLILKSCLNEGKFPAVYLAPDPFLAEQVRAEAAGLGIKTTDDPGDIHYARGRSILVVGVQKLINGRSVFGVGDADRKPIGSIVVDDAHACLGTTEKQFTLLISGNAYKPLFKLFREALLKQDISCAMDVESQVPYKSMLVPFRDWISKEREIIQIINEHGGEETAFIWPLLKKHIRLCRCVFGEGIAEISPRVIPISVISSFSSAERRVFMSATLADDSPLVSHFDVSTSTIAKAISPDIANDIGERMILVPQDASPEITDEELCELLIEKAKTYNVVVIVPSNYRAKF